MVVSGRKLVLRKWEEKRNCLKIKRLTSFIKKFECDVLSIIKGRIKFQKYIILWSFFNFIFCDFEKEIEAWKKKCGLDY
jgi:hypothetical protein